MRPAAPPSCTSFDSTRTSERSIQSAAASRWARICAERACAANASPPSQRSMNTKRASSLRSRCKSYGNAPDSLRVGSTICSSTACNGSFARGFATISATTAISAIRGPFVQKSQKTRESASAWSTHPRWWSRKKIARASDEARAKPSPYEDRRRGHRDPRTAWIVIGCGRSLRRRLKAPPPAVAHSRHARNLAPSSPFQQFQLIKQVACQLAMRRHSVDS